MGTLVRGDFSDCPDGLKESNPDAVDKCDSPETAVAIFA